MFRKPTATRVMKNVGKALRELELSYEDKDETTILLSAMGDDHPIGMVIAADETNKTLNIYCYLMFNIPEEARKMLIPELNTVNNTINNGGFYMADGEPKIYFKVVQSFFDSLPTVDTIAHLIMISFKTVDVNDGRLKDLIPAGSVIKDPMFN